MFNITILLVVATHMIWPNVYYANTNGLAIPSVHHHQSPPPSRLSLFLLLRVTRVSSRRPVPLIPVSFHAPFHRSVHGHVRSGEPRVGQRRLWRPQIHQSRWIPAQSLYCAGHRPSVSANVAASLGLSEMNDRI